MERSAVRGTDGREARETAREASAAASFLGHDDLVEEANGRFAGRFHLAIVNEFVEA